MTVRKVKRIIRTLKNLEIYGCVSIHQDHTAYVRFNKRQALETIPEWATNSTNIQAYFGQDEETKNWKLILG